MNKPNSLVDVSEGTTVSNASPQSPPGRALLEPITLDFDPMSFEFKEDSPLTSPSDSNHEQNTEVVDFFDPFCPVKEESPTDYYPNVMLGQTLMDEPLIAGTSEPQQFSAIDDSLSEGQQFSNGFANYEIQDDGVLHELCQDDNLDDYRNDDEIDDNNKANKLASDFCTNMEIPVTTSKSETSDHVEPLTELEQSEPFISPVSEQTLEDSKDDLNYQHEPCKFSEDEDVSRRDRTNSSSSSHSSKSENKAPCKPSELKCEDDIQETSISPENEDAIQKEDVIKTETLLNNEANGYSSHNGIDNTVSLKNSKNAELDGKVTKEKSVDSLASVTDLMSTYVSLTAQENQPLSSKEIISTGIDIKSLKSNYVQHSGNCWGISPDREIISTGIDVRALKTSFTKSNEGTQQSTFQEEVKPSVDRAKVQRAFSQGSRDEICLCKICGKHVYQMEKMKAEKNVFHKNCFRCKECNKLLNVDSYSSNEGDIYCKPHFRQLSQPKARFDENDSAPSEIQSDEGKQVHNEMIIRENIPAELPPNVVRSDSKPDHGLDNIPVNLSSIKSKFEECREELHLPSTTDVCTLQRSASVMARLAKYQSAVSGGNNENGELSESDNDDGHNEDTSAIKTAKQKEKVVFSGMSSLKSQWETGTVSTAKEETAEDKNEELNNLRQRICLGRSESMKAVYEKACQDTSKLVTTRTEPVDIGHEVKATRLKEKFEKGELANEVEENLEKFRKEKEDDLSVINEPGIANDAKKLFKQIDATVKTTALPPKSPNKSPLNDHQIGVHSSVKDTPVVKCSEPTEKEEIPIDTTDVSQKFKFFENYSENPTERKRFQVTPPGESMKDAEEDNTQHDPNVIRAVDVIDDRPSTDTARRMLDKFKALEKESPSVPAGPKPLKRITPPREYNQSQENYDLSPEPERDPNIVRSSYKADDGIVVEADKAKSLRAKFENWDTELKENKKNEEDDEEDFLPQVDTTKTLRAKFEAIKEDTSKPSEKSKPKVSRFIQEQTAISADMCNICGKKVYPMEKMETSGMRIHKNCFRCAHCCCMLRLENYTKSGRSLYCTPHFKQLFISRGNYDEGFGREQHKEKWNRSCNNTPVPRDLQENDDMELSNGDVQCLEQAV